MSLEDLPADSRPRPRAGDVAVAAGLRAALLALAWWVVAEGSTVVAWPYAAGVVGAATVVSLWLTPPRRRWELRPLLLARFGGWFLWSSLRGGTGVAVRALAPQLRLDPGVIDYPLRLRDHPAAAVALADVISLLPGTLAVAVHEDRITLHVLDRRGPVLATVAEAERRIAAGLGVPLGGDASGSDAPEGQAPS